MTTYIDGPESPYDYLYRITNDLFEANTTFTEIYIAIYDLKHSLEGGTKEKLKISFNDLSVITDLAGNELSDGTLIGYLNSYDYLSDEVTDAVRGGGLSMKYIIMSLLASNLLLKLVFSVSASLMWFLINVLQLFRFILMIDIVTPKVMSILLEYIAVVVGDVKEMEIPFPDLINTYIINEADLRQDVYIPAKFLERGYDSPYLSVVYGKYILLFNTILIIGVPTLYILVKVFGKFKYVGVILTGTWQGLWWNIPIRAYTEILIETTFLMFMNVINVSL